MAGLDVGIVIGYFVIIICVGFYASKKANTQENYLVAGQRLGYAVTFSCLCALLLGGASTVGTAALGYQYGVSGMWLVVSLGLGVALVGLLLYGRIRKTGIYTVAELLTKRYSPVAGVLTAVVSAVYTMMTCSVQIIAMGAILQGLAGWDPAISMTAVGAVVVLYTILGGMWAITLTDLIQFFLVVIGLFFIMTPLSLNAVGGWSALHATLPSEFFNLTTIGWGRIIQYFLLYTLGVLIGQDLWQRYLAARDVKVARRSGVAAGAFAVLFGLNSAVIGMCALVYFGQHGIELDSVQLTFATMATSVLPSGSLGLVLAAVLAVLMSTASGTLLASSALLTNDVIRPLVVYRRTKSGKAALDAVEADHQALKASRRATAVIGVLSILVAVSLNDVLVALDITYGILTGALFFPIILALFWKKASPRAAIIAIVAGLATVLLGMAIVGTSALEPIVSGLVVSGVLMVVVTLMGDKKPSGVDS